MTSLIDHPSAISLRAWYRHRRRVIIFAAAGLLAMGAFLLWGPIGLGNGPLSVGLGYGEGAVHAVSPTHPVSPGFPAAAELAAPRPGTCWVMTKVVVHYHVGIRHYSATEPASIALCADSAQVNAATKAAESA
jgi:hypothetical protein